MIAYETDPSLHTGQPVEPSLDDGFSRPQQGEEEAKAKDEGQTLQSALSEKSDF
jgi:hypothetical protein